MGIEIRRFLGIDAFSLFSGMPLASSAGPFSSARQTTS